MCPRDCGVNRYTTKGYCNSGVKAKISSYQLHFGEEPIISGYNGSGTIFFSNCNLSCVYCQNYTISQKGWGREYEQDDVVAIILKLQEQGAHNINLVTPTHYSIQLIEILKRAKKSGLKIPVVWNSSGYEKAEVIRELNGLVNIFLVDLRYYNSASSLKYSDAGDYPSAARKAIAQMNKQSKKVYFENDILCEGLIIRLLLLPDDLGNFRDNLKWIKNELGSDTYISLMSQYYPAYQAGNYPELSRGVSELEYQKAVDYMVELGFENGFIQEVFINSEWTPKFRK